MLTKEGPEYVCVMAETKLSWNAKKLVKVLKSSCRM